VSLNVGGKVVTTSTESVDPYWYGNYLLLWKPPPAGSNVLREGLIGKDVGWLRDQLDRIEGKPVSTDEKKKLSFDPTLKWRVMEFQRIRGLNVDGVAGRETMIEINSAVNDRSTPLLLRQSS
jgi:general secretion pathway protein A